MDNKHYFLIMAGLFLLLADNAEAAGKWKLAGGLRIVAFLYMASAFVLIITRMAQ